MKIMIRLFLLAALLLTVSAAGAEKTMLIAPRVEDVYLAEQYIDSDTTVMVITTLSSKQQEELDSWLSEHGTAGAVAGKYQTVKSYAESTLKSKWKIGSYKGYQWLAAQVRVAQPETLIWSVDPAETELSDYISAMMDQLVLDVYDPTFRGTEAVEQYGWTIHELIHAQTGSISAVDVSGVTASLAEKWGSAVTPEIPGLPELNAEGFLDSGSFSWKDEDAGTYYYVDADLRVCITRHTYGAKRVWYEADVLRRAGSEEYLRVTAAGETSKTKLKAKEVAAGWVLAINSDYHQNRSGKNIGIIVRSGEVISARTKTGSTYPNRLVTLDSLLLTKDGGFEVYPVSTLTADEAVEKGASDVLSFGPIYMKDGLWRQIRFAFRLSRDPRSAVGKLGDNHYLFILGEGRLTESSGMTLEDMQQIFFVRGCTDAINLDGGRTSCMYFMGEQVGAVGNGTNAIAPRTQWEMLAIGKMDEE